MGLAIARIAVGCFLARTAQEKVHIEAMMTTKEVRRGQVPFLYSTLLVFQNIWMELRLAIAHWIWPLYLHELFENRFRGNIMELPGIFIVTVLSAQR
jgi:hypothetical protein